MRQPRASWQSSVPLDQVPGPQCHLPTLCHGQRQLNLCMPEETSETWAAQLFAWPRLCGLHVHRSPGQHKWNTLIEPLWAYGHRWQSRVQSVSPRLLAKAAQLAQWTHTANKRADTGRGGEKFPQMQHGSTDKHTEM